MVLTFLRMLGELVAPTRCAACEEGVPPRGLFCSGCAVSVLEAEGDGAVFEYGGAVATAIARMKYAGRFDLAGRFGEVMGATAAAMPAVDVIVPVPLHPTRMVERGFDQAALLAGPVARRLGVRLAAGGLARTRVTAVQASLDREARGANVAGAFRCEAGLDGLRVMLVDDVRTTGATLAACAEAVRRAGAREVCSLVLARRDRAGKSQKTAEYED
jgi:ComF family protein